MITQKIQIEKMPFFEKFDGTGKAVIYTEVFENWLRESVNTDLKDQPEQNFCQEKDDKITESLNELYDTESSSVDPVLMKMQLSSIENRDW
jgi:hypothetical protein